MEDIAVGGEPVLLISLARAVLTPGNRGLDFYSRRRDVRDDSMSLFDDPLQLMIVGVIVVIFIMVGPKKIPELARALGQAKGEFSAGAAQKPTSLTGMAKALASTTVSGAGAAAGDSQLVETAEKLGIPTEGRTPQEISDAIVSRVNSNS
jgi:sec-independent protein translocase protein TatA